jgi:hypothetical protein
VLKACDAVAVAGGVFGVVAGSTVTTCSRTNGLIMHVTVHCEPTGERIIIECSAFRGIVHASRGAAIYVSSAGARVVLRTDAFFSCKTTGSASYGACAYFQSVASGTSVINSCAADCESQADGFGYLEASAQVELRGLSLFNCRSWHGAFDYVGIHVNASESNFTSLTAASPAGGSGRAAVFYENFNWLMEGSFLHLAGNSGGPGCFNTWSGGAPSFRQCSLVNNGGDNSAAQTSLIRCYVEGTALPGTVFTDGWVTVDSCLFAGDVPNATRASFIPEGTLIGNTSTEIVFDTASLLAPCRGFAGVTAVFQETLGVGNEIIVVVGRRFTATAGDLIDIGFTNFSQISNAGHGGAISVTPSTSKVVLHSDAFFSCRTTPWDSTHWGARAYLVPVASGTKVVDTCATECASWAGRFGSRESGGEVEL